MAGTRTGEFRQLISPFLQRKIAELEVRFGVDSREARALTRQYVASPLEAVIQPGNRRRHYESEVAIRFEDRPVIGVERLYRRTMLIEPTTVCAAHCRWCLRGQYPLRTMTEEDITHATRYIGSAELRDDVNEVLITGGDPLMSLPLLGLTLGELARNAPNVRIVRIGSRVPFQDPARINDAMVDMFARYPGFRFELGVNVNHPLEFWPESVDALARLQDAGFRIYNQHPLLKGVNDDAATLTGLYERLRENGIEAHYLFHSIPMRGMDHHRTSLRRGLELVRRLTAGGVFSGRSKPHYAVLSDIGKIVIYDGVIIGRRAEDNCLLLRSGFRLEERRRWNPSWPAPESLVIDDEGFMCTWYVDGTDEPGREPS
ncbi:MAG: radical SAM protein [Alphaproteobacteria bacterium]|nr:radical SAM protein [Alphaproteobacteria bacterium]MBF0128610.1 radical SAM protein [Alphaproteobacteria bacterium]